jgi:hypothetical protein
MRNPQGKRKHGRLKDTLKAKPDEIAEDFKYYLGGSQKYHQNTAESGGRQWRL